MSDLVDRSWPRPGVSAAIFRRDSVLMVKRGRPPFAGLWSLPGGHIEPGERTREAAVREVAEETGIAARIDGLADVADAISEAGGMVAAHYIITVYYGVWLSGEPCAASDAAEARFVPLAEIGRLATTENAAAVIATAWRLANGAAAG